MHNPAAILADYHRARAISNPLGTMAAQKIPKAAVESEAKFLGLWHHGRFQMSSEEEANVLFDHLVHDGSGGPSTPLQRLTAKELAPYGGEGQRICLALRQARLNIYTLTKCRPGLGWEVEDIWRKQSSLVVDVALSKMPEAKGCIAVMRLVDMGGWTYNTGIQGSTFGPESGETLSAILLTSLLAETAPTDLNPPMFTPAQNLTWSRCLLRAWLRPGSVKLVSAPVQVGKPSPRRR